MFFNPGFSLFRAKKINGKWQFRLFASNVPANDRPVLNSEGMAMTDDKGKAILEPIPLNELADDDWRKYPETTEWGIGWLPLGGYCKIAGMIDESMDKTQMALPPQEWEYRARPVWQRLPIIVGGVLVNFILAMVIYSAVLYKWGKEFLPFENASYGFQYSEIMLEQGFKHGDKIVSVDGNPVEQRSEFVEKILIDGARNVMVNRNGRDTTIKLPENFVRQILKAEESSLLEVRYPFVVKSVEKNTPAYAAGLMAGDSIVSINQVNSGIFQDVAAELQKSDGKTCMISFYRDGIQMNKKIVPENNKLGVNLVSPMSYFQTKKISYNFFESIPAGITLGWETLTGYVKQLKLIFTKEGSQQLGGFGSIGKMFPESWDWQVFWSMTALLSVILAFMNFLPIPALDGGHVMFLLYEMITGKKPCEKFMEYAQTAGMFLLLGLLIYANGNDIFKAIFK
jgi:regulator of sigma E protease